jgi:hypothetical protein
MAMMIPPVVIMVMVVIVFLVEEEVVLGELDLVEVLDRSKFLNGLMPVMVFGTFPKRGEFFPGATNLLENLAPRFAE